MAAVCGGFAEATMMMMMVVMAMAMIVIRKARGLYGVGWEVVVVVVVVVWAGGAGVRSTYVCGEDREEGEDEGWAGRTGFWGMNMTYEI